MAAFHHLQNATFEYLGKCTESSSCSVLKDPFDIQKRVHSGRDGQNYRYNPNELPGTTDYFDRNIQQALPLLKIYECQVPGKARSGVSSTIPVVAFAINQVHLNDLRSPRAVSTVLAKPGVHVMSPGRCQEHGSQTLMSSRPQHEEPEVLLPRVSTGASAGGQLI